MDHRRASGALRQRLGQPPATTTPVTVVGCGNWLHRDDRAGPRALALLASRVGREVEVVDVGTSVLGLIDRLNAQELVVLVDACVGQGSVASVIVREPDLTAARRFPGTVHQVGPLETLIVARELYPERLPRRIVLVLMETGGLGAAEEEDLSRRAAAAVLEEIDRWRSARAAGARRACGAA